MRAQGAGRALVLLPPAILLAAAGAWAAIGGRVYRNPPLRVGQLEVPRGWELTAPSQIAYPRVLVYAQSGQARFTFAAQHVAPGTTVEVVAAEARAALIKQGWQDATLVPDGERVRLEAHWDGGRRLLRQVYIVDGDMAFVLTLAAPVEHGERFLRDLDEMARTLVILPQAQGEPSSP
jgi:hypothetical protein